MLILVPDTVYLSTYNSGVKPKEYIKQHPQLSHEGKLLALWLLHGPLEIIETDCKPCKMRFRKNAFVELNKIDSQKNIKNIDGAWESDTK
ncbi:hypothetical protein ACTXT7_000321 [Hymenolepis weldensis]